LSWGWLDATEEVEEEEDSMGPSWHRAALVWASGLRGALAKATTGETTSIASYVDVEGGGAAEEERGWSWDAAEEVEAEDSMGSTWLRASLVWASELGSALAKASPSETTSISSPSEGSPQIWRSSASSVGT
jgi:hypothetical protein